MHMDGKSITTLVSAAFIRGFTPKLFLTFYDIKLPDLLQIEADMQYCLLLSKTDGLKEHICFNDKKQLTTQGNNG